MSLWPVTSSCHTTLDEVVLFTSIWLPFHQDRLDPKSWTWLGSWQVDNQDLKRNIPFHTSSPYPKDGISQKNEPLILTIQSSRLYFEIFRDVSQHLITKEPPNPPHKIEISRTLHLQDPTCLAGGVPVGVLGWWNPGWCAVGRQKNQTFI